MGIKLKDTIEGTCRKAINDGDGNNIPDTYLKKTGDAKDNTVTFETDDNVVTTVHATPEDPSGTIVGYKTADGDGKWHIMHPLDIKDRLSAAFNKLTTLFHNVRYLYELCGTTNIASIGGGTLTGAVSKLNTDILKANEVKYYNVPQPPTNSIFVSFSHWVFNITKIGRVVTITTNFAAHMKAVPLTADSDAELLILPKEYRPYALYKIFTYVTQDGFMTLVNIGGDGRIGIHNMAKEINGWLCRWTVTYIAGE